MKGVERRGEKKEKKRKKNEGVRSSRVGNETEPCINAKEIKGEEREREKGRADGRCTLPSNGN